MSNSLLSNLSFVTSNKNKWLEAKRILGVDLQRVSVDLPEYQADSTGQVALEKARAAFGIVGSPVVVEDTGLEFHALGRFPGPFIKYWEKQGGLESMCRALDGTVDRRATAVCALAVCSEQGAWVVEGRVDGIISAMPKGTNGFGWDAILIVDGQTRTFGQMTAEEKDALSHRRKAWHLLREKLQEFSAL